MRGLELMVVELEGQLYQNCNRKESFIVHWMHLTMIVGSISIDQFERLKAEFRQRDIKDYPGEDIEAMSSDFFTDYQRLNNAQAFEHNMLMIVIHKMMEAGNEDFKHFMRVLKVELNKYL